MLIKFSILQDSKRIPLIDAQGQEVTLTIDATSKSAAIYSPEVAKFCAEHGNNCRVREVR